jgi:hypothetical protein
LGGSEARLCELPGRGRCAREERRESREERRKEERRKEKERVQQQTARPHT